MALDDGFYKYQSQTDAIVAWLVRQIDALETLEEFALVYLGNAITMIANAAHDTCLFAILFRPQCTQDAGVIRTVIDCVRHQIAQCACQQGTVGIDRIFAFRNIDLQINVAAFCQRPHFIGGIK